jgi:cell division protein FtsW (lipid II flippase)
MSSLSEFQLAQIDRRQSRLLFLAGLFLAVYAACLTLAPAVQARSLAVDWPWGHWLGLAVWAGVFALAHRQTCRRLPGRDPFLLPIAALLTGWGMLTIWSVLPPFGLRQTVWVGLAALALTAGLRLPSDLGFLRRYKYVLLTASLLLTAATLLLGVNPLGYGPRMWLGCCGLYLQPSEPLKLLLIAYLAAYLADSQGLLSLTGGIRQPIEQEPGPQPQAPLISLTSRRAAWSAPLLPLIAPTLLMTGLALALLVVQRDLGTAAMLLFLYASIVYVASGRWQVLALAAGGLLIAAVVGYFAYDVIRLRVDAWLNPWLDPSGRSYQIVQALLAAANGGLIGRGPGLGSPWVVPVAHSDLIFVAVAEETGLAGVSGMLLLIALLAMRGLKLALATSNRHHRLLAAGLIAYLAGQSLLIIGGALRLLPLTGVTLPFVSYGGSSLLVSVLAVLLLLHISRPPESLIPRAISPALQPEPYLHLGAALGLGLAACALAAGWWAVYRAGDLLARTDNPRRVVSDRFVRRGSLLDRAGEPINESQGQPGKLTRRYRVPELSNVVGYIDPTYGQSGLEASQDGYLRGLQGYPASQVWWHHLVYGQPPPGLDLRLSLDLELQKLADQALQGRRGAAVILNAQTGEILAMACSPTFDASHLSENWEQLVNDRSSPLLNRAVLGRYPLGELERRLFPDGLSRMGVTPTPRLELPTGDLPPGGSTQQLTEPPTTYSPLQVALAAAALSADGLRPAPRLVSAVNTPQLGWTPVPALDQPFQALSPEQARSLTEQFALPGGYWQSTALAGWETDNPLTWSLAGSLPGQTSPPYALALVLEEANLQDAGRIGAGLMNALLFPNP